MAGVPVPYSCFCSNICLVCVCVLFRQRPWVWAWIWKYPLEQSGFVHNIQLKRMAAPPPKSQLPIAHQGGIGPHGSLLLIVAKASLVQAHYR